MPDVLGRHLSNGAFTAPKHVRLISWLLLLNSTGYVRRLGVSMPPGSGKSLLIDHYNPTWRLEHDVRRRIVVASYSGELAEEQGKAVRATIEANSDQLGVRVLGDSRAADRWRTVGGGGMWTVGTGGTLTGRRASDMVIDDPHKDFASALSPKQNGDTWNWYGAVARTRLLPRANLTVVQTRWAEQDLLGRLKSQDENRGEWLFVALPAIAEQDETIETVLGEAWAARLRAQNLVLPAWHRVEGEPLWPELSPGVAWFDEHEYNEIRAEVGEVVWAGLYQQRPAPAEGNLFKRADWRRLDGGLPGGKYIYVRRWDLASVEGSGDWTASCLMAANIQTRLLYIVEMRRARLAPADVKAYVHATAVEDRERYGHVLTRVEREPGSSGKGVESDYLLGPLAGFPASFVPSSGPKDVRALPLSGQVGAGNVYLVRRNAGGGEFVVPDWWQWLIDEAAVFPNGTHDDLVDVASLAYVDIVEELPRRGRAQIQSSARRNLGF